MTAKEPLSKIPADGTRRVEDYSQEPTQALLDSLYSFFELLGKRYNSTVHDEPLKVSVSRSEQKAGVVSKINSAREVTYRRLIVSTSHWAISIRAEEMAVRFFILPATELWSLPQSELSSREKLVLKVHDSESGAWVMNEVIVTADEMNALMRGLFKDVIRRSSSDFDSMTDAMRLIASGHSFSGSIRSLVEEKHALVQKIVNQQESILSQVTRELHDTVLGNVMLLKRSFAGAKPMPPNEVAAVLDQIAISIREVCQDLSPRDLMDCGLQLMLEELCTTFSVRSGCNCKFSPSGTIPEFSSEITLHIYRIAQECLTNVAKHSGATQVELSVTADNETFLLFVTDNGTGFGKDSPPERRKDSGLGAGILRERSELINCVFPCRIWVDSSPEKGTRVSMEIVLARHTVAKPQSD